MSRHSARASRSPSRSRAPRAASCTSGRCPRTRTTQTVPVSATAKFAPEIPTRAVRNLRRRWSRAASASAAGSSVEVGQVELGARTGRGSRPGSCGSPARGCATATSSPSWMISSARSVSTAAHARRPPGLVQPDLVGRDRLDLDHLVDAVGARDPGHDRAGLVAVARPVHDAAGVADGRLEALQLAVSQAERPVLDRPRPPRAARCQSGSSPTTAARLARIVVVAFLRLRRS